MQEAKPKRTRKPLRHSEIIDMRGLQSILPFSTRTIWARVADGSLPKPFRLPGSNKSLWRRSDIDGMIERAIEQSRRDGPR